MVLAPIAFPLLGAIGGGIWGTSKWNPKEADKAGDGFTWILNCIKVVACATGGLIGGVILSQII